MFILILLSVLRMKGGTLSFTENLGRTGKNKNQTLEFNLGKIKNAYYFQEDKTAVLGAIKAQLPFSEGKYQLLNS